ncbi:stage II sporulation protein M [Oscillatoria sp. CS-180]|uniref:stage II sporulation protein M n=1 Tax=Oscillatoria sp. CS-180 TaxID=3021720 RepID=UPI00232F4523|nr:stage II sporulation protein M [Oscillatoria sp. CS-180]MDB9527050.1 stage II sporulation protein M [Oscillatoria sp. CS-180]
MNIQRWIARREASWRQLDDLLNRAEKQGLNSLKTTEIKTLASLYRSVSADLARARTHHVGDVLIQDLQGLTSRSYSQIYQGSRRQDWQSVLAFYQYGFPAAVRASWVYIAIATVLFVTSGLIAWWYSWQDPSFMSLVLSPGFVAEVQESEELWTVSILGREPVASSAIMVNNIGVCFKAIFGGVAYFLPEVPIVTPPGGFTVFILVLNGLMIGSVATLVAQTDLAYDLWAFVFPHGSLELPAIFFAGGAGLLLARAILLPGNYRRIDALQVYGRQAAELVYGIVPMLVIAGIIEGFYSPSPFVPNLIKYATGSVLFLILITYCLYRPAKDV